MTVHDSRHVRRAPGASCRPGGQCPRDFRAACRGRCPRRAALRIPGAVPDRVHLRRPVPPARAARRCQGRACKPCRTAGQGCVCRRAAAGNRRSALQLRRRRLRRGRAHRAQGAPAQLRRVLRGPLVRPRPHRARRGVRHPRPPGARVQDTRTRLRRIHARRGDLRGPLGVRAPLREAGHARRDDHRQPVRGQRARRQARLPPPAHQPAERAVHLRLCLCGRGLRRVLHRHGLLRLRGHL